MLRNCQHSARLADSARAAAPSICGVPRLRQGCPSDKRSGCLVALALHDRRDLIRHRLEVEKLHVATPHFWSWGENGSVC